MRRLYGLLIFLLGIILEIKRYGSSQLNKALLLRKWRIINFFADLRPINLPKNKLLVVIAHVASSQDTESEEKGYKKIEKLKRTIDGVMHSFSHYDLQIVINTIPNRHVTRFLPSYQQAKITVVEQENVEPMLVGFRAQDEFIERVEKFDWFVFLEDDIIINDSTFIDKIECFNRNSNNLKYILLPHRYEMLDGQKTYIDFTYSEKENTASLTWNKLSIVTIGSVEFCEFCNPHSGFYCLSQSQLKLWIDSGRFWKNQDIIAGPLESAATFCLFETFSLYKPHPDFMHFLEVQHWDSKYSQYMKDNIDVRAGLGG